MQNKSFILFFLLILNTSFAIEKSETGQVSEKEFKSPILNNFKPYKAVQELEQNKRSEVNLKLASMGIQPQSAFLDQRNDKFGTLITSIPLILGNGKNNNHSSTNHGLNKNNQNPQVLKALAWNAFIEFLQSNRSSLDIDIDEMQNPATVTVLNDGNLIQINSKRIFNGIRVRDSYISGVINNGNLVLTGAKNWGDITLSIEPTISINDAKSTVSQYLGNNTANANWGKSELVFIPVASGPELFKLVHSFNMTFNDDPLANWEALVDANSNELLAFKDNTHYAETRQLVGGQLPVSNDDVAPDGVEVVSPMPFADLTVDGETYFTDTGGNVLACLDGDSSTTLNGRYLTMVDQCGSINESDAGPIHNLGTNSGTDCSIPSGASSGNTRSSRSGYYEINRMIELAQSQLPNNSWIRNPLVSNMNINNNCNASYNGQLNFFTSGGGCGNTGEIAGVFDHEWGHGMDDHDANPGIQSPSGEGIADTYASLRLNSSCIGRNFRETFCTGFGDACTECTGVRDIDWEKHVSGLPHDIAWSDATCGGSVHCVGMLIGETIWDLWNRDLTAAPYNMDSNTARELATQLTFQGSGPVGSWFLSDGSGNGDGCNADSGYLNFLAADDDDGDLSNGTPHMAAIFASFDRHGMACATPTVQDSGCSGIPTLAPTVSITASDRTNILSWNAVAGANGYKVYRTEGVFGCDFGKTLIAETSNLSHMDTGLSNGREYYYTVVPMGNGASCFGPSSSCTSSTPVPQANFAIDNMSTQLIFNSGDNDSYIDNCESVTVNFDIANIGNGLATNVIIDSITSPTHSSIDASIVTSSVSPNNFAECANGSTGFSFNAQDLAFGDVLDFNVCMTSDELAPQIKCGTISFSNVQSNDQFFATKTYDFEQDENWQVMQGTFDRNDSGAASSGTFATRSSSFLDGQCDEIISPRLKLSATSTLSIDTNYDIENNSGQWWDRANVSLLFENGTQTVIAPDGGRQYNTNNDTYGGCNSGQLGWAATADTWDTSTWSSTALDALGNQNQTLSLFVNYGMDGAVVGRGFWFDDVTVTDVTIQVADENICSVDSYTVSGTVSDLNGSVTIQNNGTDDITISDADSQSFQFASAINDGDLYAVTVFGNPLGQTCTVTGGDVNNIGSGTISGENVTNILVTCNDNFSTAMNDDETVLEDAPATVFDVLANDSNSINGAAPITIITDPNNGTSIITNNGDNLSYAPDAEYCNDGVTTDDFTYTITGGSSADVNVNVTCVNDAPSFDLDENIYVKLSDIPENTEGPAANPVACNVNLGPGDENTNQQIDSYSVVITDPNNVIENLSISNIGALNATYTGNIGIANIDVTLKDNGGVDNNGVDSTTKQMNIHVSDYIFKGGFELETCQ